MTPADLARRAQAALRAGRRDEARRLGRALAAMFPDHQPSWFTLAALQGDPDRSAAGFRRALRIDPGRAVGWAVQAEALLRGRRWAAAEMRARYALVLDPAHGSAWRSLATALRHRGQATAAIRAADRALVMLPGDGIAESCRIGCLLVLGQIDAALVDYRAVTGGSAIIAVEARFDELFDEGADHLASIARPRRCVWDGGDRAGFSLAPRVGRLERALLMPEKWVLLVERRHLLLEETNHNPSEIVDELGCVKFWAQGRYLIDLDRAIDVVDGPAALIGGNSNYYHWLVDYLPRLAAVELLGGREPPPVLIAVDLPAAALETLDHLGIASARRRALAPDRLYDCRDLIVASLPSRYGFTHPWAIGWLRARLQGTRPAKGWRRLHVTRRDARHRRVTNEADLEAMLAARGFETVALGDLGFAAQRDLFADADLVVGVHGAGLANLVFAPDGARILELVPSAYPANYFANLAQASGIRLRQMPVATRGPRHVPPSRWPITVVPDELAAAIDSWDAER